MKTKNRPPAPAPKENTGKPLAFETDSIPPASASAEKAAIPKIVLTINPNGSIDVEHMSSRTVDRLKKAINVTPGLQEQQKAAEPVQIFHPKMVEGLYDALGMIEASIFPMFFKNLTPEMARKAFTYSPQEKELLAVPTCKVINKYAAEWMIKYQDEIALATLLISTTLAKVNAAIILSRQSQSNVVEMPKKEEDDTKAQAN